MQASPQAQQVIEQRPPTAKPKAPDELDIEDPEVAQAYTKLYDKYQQMEKLLEEKNGGKYLFHNLNSFPVQKLICLCRYF